MRATVAPLAEFVTYSVERALATRCIRILGQDAFACVSTRGKVRYVASAGDDQCRPYSPTGVVGSERAGPPRGLVAGGEARFVG